MIAFKFKFDPLEGLADKIERAAARGRFALAAVDAVNIVTTRANTSLQAGEIANINLTPAYVKSKTDVQLASGASKARATITTKGDLTVLGRFGVTMASMQRTGGVTRDGPRPARLNSGTSYRIRKNAPAFEPQWFVLPLRKGSEAGGNSFGVFVRDSRIPKSKRALREGKAGKRHIYGPSPYQLFKEQIRLQGRDIQDDLARTALEQMGAELEKAF